MPVAAGWRWCVSGVLLVVASAVYAAEKVPDAAFVTAAQTALREQFKPQYGDTSASGRLLLGRRLFTEGLKEPTDVSRRYVLLTEAREVCAKAGDITTALGCVAQLKHDFAIDSIPMTDAALQLASRAEGLSPLACRIIAEAALRLGQSALGIGQIDRAGQMLEIAQEMGRGAKTPSLTTLIAPLATDLKLIQGEQPKLAGAMQLMKDNPRDKGANMFVGRFVCLIGNDWTGGLPMLAKGSDVLLADLAAREQVKPSTAEALRRLAEDWDAQAAKQPPAYRPAIARRAARWYQAVLPELSGEQKLRAQNRLGALEADQAVLPAPELEPATNRLLGFDPARDMTKGVWQVVPEGLLSDRSPRSRIELPVDLPAEYELRLDCTRIGGTGSLQLLLPFGRTQFGLDIGGGDGLTFSVFDTRGKPVRARAPRAWIVTGRRLLLRLRVQPEGLSLGIDDQAPLSLPVRWGEISLPEGTRVKSAASASIVSNDAAWCLHGLWVFKIGKDEPTRGKSIFD